MNILGIVPARAGSKGIPGKNIRLMAGKPLIAHTILAAKESKMLSRTILTTDSEAIAKIGREYGIEVPFLRPTELADDSASAFDYIKHCLDYLESKQYRPEVIVLLQPTCPLRTSQDIDNSVNCLFERSVDSVVSVTEMSTKNHPCWQFRISDTGKLTPFVCQSWSELATRRQNIEPTFTRNGATYVFRYETFRRCDNIFGQRVHAYEMPAERSVNIDDIDDWVKAEALFSKKKTHLN